MDAVNDLNNNHNSKRPFLIGVGGGVSSGKSSVCKKILDQITVKHKKQILIVNFDSFYRKLTPDEHLKAQRGEQNFDHPSSFDDELALKTITDLLDAKEVQIPTYDYLTCDFKPNEVTHVKKSNAPDLIIVQGILIFYYPKIRDLFHLKLFVDCDADVRLSKRVLRDMKIYERDLEIILSNYVSCVKPCFEEFGLPTKKYADVIIPRGADNVVAVKLIVKHIEDLLNHKLSLSAINSAATTTSSTTPTLNSKSIVYSNQSNMIIKKNKKNSIDNKKTLTGFSISDS